MKTTLILIILIILVLVFSLVLYYSCENFLDSWIVFQQDTNTFQTGNSLLSLPVGTIAMISSSQSLPENWILCDGNSTYVGNNNLTLTAPNLNSSNTTLCQIAQKANYNFILKVKSNTGDYNKISYYSPIQNLDQDVNGIVTFFDANQKATNNWKNLNSSPVNFYTSDMMQSGPVESPELQNYQLTYGNYVTQLNTQITQNINQLNSENSPSYTIPNFLDPMIWGTKIFATTTYLTWLNNAIQQSSTDIFSANSSAFSIWAKQYSYIKNLFAQLKFIQKVNDTSTGSLPSELQLVVDNAGNLFNLSPLPTGTIILWNNEDSAPDSSFWTSLGVGTNLPLNTVIGTWTNSVQIPIDIPTLPLGATLNPPQNTKSTINAYSVFYSIVPDNVSFYYLS